MSVEVTRLPSGLVVVTDAMPHLQTASLGVWVGCGSRDEHADEHGISHLLEHMAFKGTARRSARQIAEEIEAVGGDINASTGVESTAYYARVLKSDVPLALDVLADILANPAFEPDELAREQNVIVQEIGACEDTPDDLVFELLQETAFPDQPVGRSILGTPETVCSFDGKKLRAYLDAQLPRSRHGDRCGRRGRSRRGTCRGRADGSRASTARAPRSPSRRVSAAAFASKRAISSRSISPSRSKVFRSATRASTAFRSSPTCWAAGCRRACSRRCGRCAASAIRSTPTIRLYADTGFFALYAGTDEQDAPELMQVVIDEITAASETVSEAEVARAKAQMKAGMLMALESSGARAEQLARQMIVHGRPIPLDEIAAKVECRDGRERAGRGQGVDFP